MIQPNTIIHIRDGTGVFDYIRYDNMRLKESRWFELDTSRHRTRPMLADEPVPR